jgi:pentatricopeptide repeat protein
MPVVEEDIDNLFKLLDAPVEQLVGPSASKMTKLDPDYLRNLKLSFVNSSELEREDLEKLEREANSTSLVELQESPSLEAISRVIQVNALLHRPKEAQEAFDLINSAGHIPDEISINHLMNAYASTANVAQASKTFKLLRQHGVAPSSISYGILIKACVNANELRAAFRVYETMKAKGCKPDVPIFTMLIKGCIRTGDLQRAWKTFDYMRGEICPADNVLYTLMIHACSKNQEAERALDLFKEMADRGIQATDVTYTSLIQACGSRPDYYHEALALLDQMVAEGFKPTKRTMNVVLGVAAKNGDLNKAREIWNEMLDKADEDPTFFPDAFSFSAMLNALERSAKLYKKKGKQLLESMSSQSPSDALDEPVAESGSSESPALSPSSSISSSASLSVSPSPIIDNPTSLSEAKDNDVVEAPSAKLYLDSIDISPKQLFKDADTLWAYLQSSRNDLATNEDSQVMLPYEPPPAKVTAAMTDRYLAIYCSLPQNAYSASKALQIFESAYKPEERTGRTFSLVVGLASRDKKVMQERGKELWDKLLEWDRLMEESLTQRAVGKMTKEEIELQRKLEQRGKDTMFRNFVAMVQGYTRINDVESALALIESASSFREPYYLHPIRFSNIPSLLDKARDMAEDGDRQVAERLKELCPPPVDNPLDEVRRILKTNWVGRNWWGWEALGVDEHVRQKIIRSQMKEKRRRDQYFTGKRKK